MLATTVGSLCAPSTSISNPALRNWLTASRPMADTYERHIRQADRAVDTLRARLRESTELSLLRRRAAELRTKTAEVTAEIDTLGARHEAVFSQWRALWPAGLITVQLPGEMVEWLARRDAAVAMADD